MSKPNSPRTREDQTRVRRSSTSQENKRILSVSSSSSTPEIRPFIPPKPKGYKGAKVLKSWNKLTPGTPLLYVVDLSNTHALFPLSRHLLGTHYLNQGGFPDLQLVELSFTTPADLAARSLDIPLQLARSLITNLNEVEGSGFTETALRLWARDLKSDYKTPEAIVPCTECNAYRTLTLIKALARSGVGKDFVCADVGVECHSSEESSEPPVASSPSRFHSPNLPPTPMEPHQPTVPVQGDRPREAATSAAAPTLPHLAYASNGHHQLAQLQNALVQPQPTPVPAGTDLLQRPNPAPATNNTIPEGYTALPVAGQSIEDAYRLLPPYYHSLRYDHGYSVPPSSRRLPQPPLYHPGQPLQSPAHQQIMMGYGVPAQGTVLGSNYLTMPVAPGLRTNQYVRGILAYSLSSPAGTEEERAELADIECSKYWMETKILLTWEMQARAVSDFPGEGSEAYADWISSLNSFFTNNRIANTLLQAKLAEVTLRLRARLWLQAHQAHTPPRLYSYAQFVEWVRIELVPEINPQLQHRAWERLAYRGSIEEFFLDVDRLTRIYPLPFPEAQHWAARVFGQGLEDKTDAAQATSQPHGLSMLHWQSVVKEYVRETEKKPGFCRWLTGLRGPRFRAQHPPTPHVPAIPQPRALPAPRQVQALMAPTPEYYAEQGIPMAPPSQVNAPQVSLTETSPNKPERPLRIGTGPRPCFCCGSDKHGWTMCDRKKPGRCGVCGAQDHYSRICAKRYFPAPGARVEYAEALELPTPFSEEDPIGTEMVLPPPAETSPISSQPPPFVEELDVVHPAVLTTSVPKECDPPGTFVEHRDDHDHLRTASTTATTGTKNEFPTQEWGLEIPDEIPGDRNESWAKLLSQTPWEGPKPVIVSEVGNYTVSRRLVYPITLDGIPVKALLDSGANTSFLSVHLITNAGLQTTPLTEPFPLGLYIGNAPSWITH